MERTGMKNISLFAVLSMAFLGLSTANAATLTNKDANAKTIELYIGDDTQSLIVAPGESVELPCKTCEIAIKGQDEVFGVLEEDVLEIKDDAIILKSE